MALEFKDHDYRVPRFRPGIFIDEDFEREFLDDEAPALKTLECVLQYAEDISTVVTFPTMKRKSSD